MDEQVVEMNDWFEQIKQQIREKMSYELKK